MRPLRPTPTQHDKPPFDGRAHSAPSHNYAYCGLRGRVAASSGLLSTATVGADARVRPHATVWLHQP